MGKLRFVGRICKWAEGEVKELFCDNELSARISASTFSVIAYGTHNDRDGEVVEIFSTSQDVDGHYHKDLQAIITKKNVRVHAGVHADMVTLEEIAATYQRVRELESKLATYDKAAILLAKITDNTNE